MVLVGGIGVVLVGSPYLGANAGGAVAMTAGSAWPPREHRRFLTFAGWPGRSSRGRGHHRVRAARPGRPADDRGSLGRFLAKAQDGTGGAAIHRAIVANVDSVISSR